MFDVFGVCRRCVVVASSLPHAPPCSDIARGKKGRNFSKHHKQGHRLNEHERKAANRAKKDGFLRMGAGCSSTLTDAHLRYCYRRRIPYMAVSAHGDSVVVDVSPVGGAGDSADDARTYKVLVGWQAVLKTVQAELPGGVQVSNEESRVDPRTVEASDMIDLIETPVRVYCGLAGGRGACVCVFVVVAVCSKSVTTLMVVSCVLVFLCFCVVCLFFQRVDADKEIGDKFTLLVSKRRDAEHACSALWAWFAGEFGMLTPEEAAAAKAEKYAARKQKWEARMRRRLRAVAADPKLLKRLPRGALDGFIKADEAGEAHKY